MKNEYFGKIPLDKGKCSYQTMFKDSQREIFTEIFKQSCFFKNQCEIDIENLTLEVKN